MKQITKATKVDLVVEALRAESLTGKWNDRIPGVRVLASRLGVSPPTVALALAKLVELGELVGGGARKSFRLAENSDAPKAKHVVSRKRLLILVHMEIRLLVDSTRSLLEKLREQMSRKGWIVEIQVLDFIHVKHMQRSWDRGIEVDDQTSVIAVYGRASLAEWAVKRGIRIMFLGGDVGEHPVPLVGVKSARIATDALTLLTKLGHSRIVIPLCDRTECFKEGMREVTRKAIEASGHSYVPSYHNPESTYLQSDVTWRIIESIFKMETPTAFVFLDWKELVTASCYFWSMGIKVPQDISLVLLNDTTEAEWFQPSLTRYQFPYRRIVTSMVRWLENKTSESSCMLMEADFIEGHSTGPPRRSSLR